MSIAMFALAGACISETSAAPTGTKTPPKRRTQAIGDQKLVAEAR